MVGPYQKRPSIFGLDYLTNRFHFSVRVYCNGSRMTSEREKNYKVRHETKSSAVTFCSFHAIGVFRDLLQYIRTAK